MNHCYSFFVCRRKLKIGLHHGIFSQAFINEAQELVQAFAGLCRDGCVTRKYIGRIRGNCTPPDLRRLREIDFVPYMNAGSGCQGQSFQEALDGKILLLVMRVGGVGNQ